MDRPSRTSYAIWWLFLVHALADVAVGVYRVHDLDREVTDVLSAALARGQLSLLAIWLAAGVDPLSWRLCGLIGGVCFLFVVFSRTALPGHFGLGGGAYWLEEEWAYYFRLTAPGDLLVKAPVLIGGIVGPLAAWRIASRMFGSRASREDRGGRRFQFGLREAAIWMVTISLTLAAVFRTAPYEEWLAESAAHWREAYRLDDAASAYSLASGLCYAIIALIALWAVYGTHRWPIQAIVALLTAGAVGYGLEAWLHRIDSSSPPGDLRSIWSQTSSELAISLLSFAAISGSLALYRAYHVLLNPHRRDGVAGGGA